ncbi:MAG: chemotaxis-specific protein-glutamate methyltransferase CheB [Deltaproteobacteria bacterium]|nr:chemotaxis-specific protein-glutamate methyltransferase CheB [Deltaproteobacteria bacterium]
MDKPLRVLIVDDSAFNRRTLTKLLESIGRVEVVGTASNGQEGLMQAMKLTPDLITLDIEMPVMDGFTFLRILMKANPIPVLVISSRYEDTNIFKAMELGAIDFIPKPAHTPSMTLFNIKDELDRKIKMLPYLKMDKIQKGILKTLQDVQPEVKKQVQFRRSAIETGMGFEVIAVGSSTGGPPALSTILSHFPEEFPVSVMVSQHMPPGFTKPFAERLNKICTMNVREAGNNEEVRRGDILIAPGGYHLCFKRTNRGIVTDLVEKRGEDRYVPSVDTMFSSCASIWAERAMGVVLTGMGNDGAKGVVRIKEMGGYTMAESEETSIVFGMPESAITTGKIDEVVPLYDIGMAIVKRCIADLPH